MIYNFPRFLLTGYFEKNRASSGMSYNVRFLFQNMFNLVYVYQYQHCGNTRTPLSVLVKTHPLKVDVLFG